MTLKYDIRASCFGLDNDYADGAYELIGDNQTPEEICEALLSTLKEGFELSGGGTYRIQINIGPAGTGDNLPL